MGFLRDLRGGLHVNLLKEARQRFHSHKWTEMIVRAPHPSYRDGDHTKPQTDGQACVGIVKGEERIAKSTREGEVYLALKGGP